MLAATLGLGLAASAGCGQVKLPGDGDDIDAGSGAPDAMQPGPVDPGLTSSFEITAALTYTDSSFPFPPELLPERHEFVLRLDNTGATAAPLPGSRARP